MSEAYGAENLWWGRFSGGKEIMGFGGHDPIFVKTFERCFTAKESCDRWLYEMKSEYSMPPRWNQCDRGYGSRVPLKPWWAPKPPR